MLTYNTPEFSPKQIIVLYLKFKLLLVLSIIPGLLFFIFALMNFITLSVNMIWYD